MVIFPGKRKFLMNIGCAGRGDRDGVYRKIGLVFPQKMVILRDSDRDYYGRLFARYGAADRRWPHRRFDRCRSVDVGRSAAQCATFSGFGNCGLFVGRHLGEYAFSQFDPHRAAVAFSVAQPFDENDPVVFPAQQSR